jgi:hypothetical protein
MPPPTGEHFKKTQLLYFAFACATHVFSWRSSALPRYFIVKVIAFVHKARRARDTRAGARVGHGQCSPGRKANSL